VAHRVDEVLEVGAELGVVVAFGQIIKPHVLAELPMVNLHFSLLPRWRGAAPVERAILAGDHETGVCVMAVEEGLDTGGVYAQERLVIGPDETAASLRARLVDVGTPLLTETLSRPLGHPVPQVGEPTYAAKVTPEDLELKWQRPAAELARLPRVGKAWTTFRGKRLLVLAARAVAAEPVADPVAAGGTAGGAAAGGTAGGVAAGGTAGGVAAGELEGTVVRTIEGGLELLTVQPEGKAPLAGAAWRNGARPAPGERLGA
jgi:methionyl-tRNA formyltransferase